MLRQVAKRAAQGANDAVASGRSFYSLSLEFTEDVAPSKPKQGGGDLAKEWAAKRAATEEALKMAATYKDIGDLAGEPYLKYHNPRTFEDLSGPVPNFRKFGLKAGEVPKFFDGVLQARASAAVAAKDAWWAQRREAVAEAAKERPLPPFAPVPVPKWPAAAAGVPMAELQAATDAALKGLEPKRKLAAPGAGKPAVSAALAEVSKALGPEAGAAVADSLKKALASKAVVTEGGKPVPGFKPASSADAEAALAARRSEVHARWVKMWAKRVLATPEQALVPLKERDALLASKFEDAGDKYNDLADLVARGPGTYGERLAECAGMDSFFLRRSKDEVRAMFPPTDAEKEAGALAEQLADPSAALSKLLGPALLPPGAARGAKSEEAAAATEHLYTPDRYMYAEGMKLAERYKAEEAEAAASAGGADAPSRALAAAAEEAGPGHAYLDYARARHAAVAADPANAAGDDVLHPELVKERFDIEMAELDARDAALAEAEEEEAWALTLARQSAHLARHLEFDLPQAQLAHMDPILYKKIDWEVTHGHDLWHHEAFQAADCEQGEYVKDQMGLEALSHHLLPLIRYRRAKARAAHGYWAPELTRVPAGPAAAAAAPAAAPAASA